MPLTTTEFIVNKLHEYLETNNADLEVFTSFPSDTETVSEGIYITRFYQESRTKSFVTMNSEGSLYEIVDRLELYLIQGADNPYVDNTLDTISDFIDNDLFIDYFVREYTVEQLYRKSNESYRIIFSLTRYQTL